jgi:zinc transporter 1
MNADNSVIELSSDKQQKEMIEKHMKKQQRRQHHLKNTFGWTRIDVLTMLIVCIFLASLCFSVLVESIQTLIHIDHQDTMHLPLPVLIVGTMGILLNGLSYLLIGGYSFRRNSLIHLTSKGDVILNRVISRDQSKNGSNETIQSNNTKSSQDSLDKEKRQNIHDICRDLCSKLILLK